MSTRMKRRIWAGLLLTAALLVAALLPAAGSRPAKAAGGLSTIVCTNGNNFHLRASDGYISTPDGNSVYMWGYGNADATGDFQMPGPVLCVNEGDTVSVSLHNDLGEPVSIAFPGQEDVMVGGDLAQPQFDGSGHVTSLTNTAAPGGDITYTFTASHPGTYLYESGTEPDKQVQMGLYGALIVRPDGHSNWAYGSARTAFDAGREYLVLMDDIDPNLHFAVEHGRPYHAAKFTDRYWTVNGRAFPDTIADNGAAWLPNQPYGALVRVEANAAEPVLVRMLNAGMVNHPFHPHANHVRTIARDGRLLEGPAGQDTSMEAFTKTLGSGETADVLFRWDDVESWSSGGNAVPVPIPGLQDLTFKDGASFYSGSPYLGEQDELPVGTTSYNECGEFYFPWHSHALNEFQNFDEGFGGLATLVRVDPPGGCATP
jgi:FtsP/CotA-like multicopper oxidase with cupredoxin domain